MDGGNCVNFLKLDNYSICMIYDAGIKRCSKDCKYYKRRPYNRNKMKNIYFRDIKEHKDESTT